MKIVNYWISTDVRFANSAKATVHLVQFMTLSFTKCLKWTTSGSYIFSFFRQKVKTVLRMGFEPPISDALYLCATANVPGVRNGT